MGDGCLEPSPKVKKISSISCCSCHFLEHGECDMTPSIFFLMFDLNLVCLSLFLSFLSLSLSLSLFVSLISFSLSLKAYKIGSSYFARWDEWTDNHPAAFFRSPRKISMTSQNDDSRCEVKALL